QPAAGDAGGAVGAALAAYHLFAGKPRHANGGNGADAMAGGYLGPRLTPKQTEEGPAAPRGAVRPRQRDRPIARTRDARFAGSAVGWFQGRMEFGPRALGARSIIADPRSPQMQKTLNLRVKYRESFRPFAPAVLREDVADWFEFNEDSPYMLLVAEVV